MHLLRRNVREVSSLGILASAFHPPTRAHIGLAESALRLGLVEHVLFVLPEALPHKSYDNVTFDERLALLMEASQGFSVATTTGGLFLEIAAECHPHFSNAKPHFLCGRDAAERIVNWNYGELPPIRSQLDGYELIVAPRQGLYTPPTELAHAIRSMPIDQEYDEVSSTEVRRRIAAGEPWAHLVPEVIEKKIRAIYS